LDAISGLLDSSTGALGVTAFLEFAPFRTRFNQIGKTPQGTYLRSGGQFRYLSAVSSTITLFGQIGGEFLDIGLTSNSIYVGSSYFALTGGAGARFHFIDALSATVEANLLPTLMTDTNDGAFGRGGFSLAVSAGAGLELRSFEPLLLSASYDFTMFSPEHPKPTSQDYSGPASGTDIIHAGGASIGYQF
ncbi:MAG: hypothetical protein ABEK29_01215, partial [Bradymonadaceae bacterium]